MNERGSRPARLANWPVFLTFIRPGDDEDHSVGTLEVVIARNAPIDAFSQIRIL